MNRMRLAESDFDLLVKSINLTDKTKKMAYEYLVLGKSSAEVGCLYKVTKQAAHKAAKNVFSLFLAQGCPDGWLVITLKCPPELADGLKTDEQERLKKFHLNNQRG